MNSATTDQNATNSPETQSAVRWSDLLACGWFEANTGNEIVINYQSADGSIGYRYKGQTRRWNTSRKSFLRRFKNYNEQANDQAQRPGAPDAEQT